MSKHTPGPWTIRNVKGRANKDIKGEGGRQIARCAPCRDHDGHHHAKHNARLIAAAPEMYDALVSSEKILRECGRHDCVSVVLRALLAKIDGEVK